MSTIQDTRSVPADSAADYWRQLICQGLQADCRVEPLRQGPFQGHLCLREQGTMQLLEIEADPFSSRRAGEGRPGWVSVLFQLEGESELLAAGHTTPLAAGQLCLVPPDRPVTVDRLTRSRQLIFNVPQACLTEVLREWPQLAGRRLGERSDAAARAATAMAACLASHFEALPPGRRAQLGDCLLAMMGNLAQPDGRGGGALASFQRQRVESHLMERLHDGELSVASVAGELGLSTRYLHKLFRGPGGGLMHWVQDRRLSACRQALASGQYRSVSEVAYAWGFNSLAHFSRAFRQRYGCSPSEV